MSAQGAVSGGPEAGQSGCHVVPRSPAGWWALGLSLAALASWVILPLVTINFREIWPVTDTWVMPVILLIITDAAAVLDVLCIWKWKERSVLNVVVAVPVILGALYITFMVVGEGLAGV